VPRTRSKVPGLELIDDWWTIAVGWRSGWGGLAITCWNRPQYAWSNSSERNRERAGAAAPFCLVSRLAEESDTFLSGPATSGSNNSRPSMQLRAALRGAGIDGRCRASAGCLASSGDVVAISVKAPLANTSLPNGFLQLTRGVACETTPGVGFLRPTRESSAKFRCPWREECPALFVLRESACLCAALLLWAERAGGGRGRSKSPGI